MSSQDDLILLGDTFRCNECPDDIILRTFYTEEDLLNHKFEQIDRGQGHLKCHHCDWEFHTAEGLREHYKKTHPVKQELACPGCQKTFTRLGGLMGHLEDDLCVGIRNIQMEERRLEKAQFINGLEQLQAEHGARIRSSVQFAPAKGNANFSRYMGLSKKRDPLHMPEGTNARVSPPQIQDRDTKTDTANSEGIWENINPWAQSEKTESPTEAAVVATAVVAKPAEKHAVLAAEPAERKAVAARQAPQLAEWEIRELMCDPDSGYFSAARCWNPGSKRYKCPHGICNKGYGSPDALIGHLRSRAHRGSKFQCPTCMRFFSTATGLTSHAENSTARCRIRDSDNYRQFIDQLTAGLTDVDGRHTDDSVRYVVPENAAAPFMEALTGDRHRLLMTESQRAHDDASQRAHDDSMQLALKEKNDFWKHHKPEW